MASKRACPSSAASAAKKSRTVADSFDTVIEGLKQAELPAAVMKTLCGIVPYCLGVPTEQRHRFQTEAIERIEGVFATVVGSLEQCIEAGQLAKQKAEDDALAQKAVLEKMSAMAQTRRDEAKAQKLALAAVAQEFQASKKALGKLKEQQEVCRVEAAGKRSQLEGLALELDAVHSDSALAETFTARVCKHLEIPESVRPALVTAASQAPASRDSSSCAVVQQVRELLSGCVAELSLVIAGSDSGAQGIESAEKEHAVLAEKQVKAARRYTEAADAAASSQSELEMSEQAMTDLRRAAKEADEALEEALANRDLFSQGPLEALATLRGCCASSAETLPCDTAVMA
mmetsp:Transcript_41460/g.90449  ORF Transcript_41460/g.90449 Transcript_41460/m.90449 type:complete len:345 (-) Transcript_41460:107-1141(-)|eukprot:CAMPEP_0170623486 /NCGR_PEP_ID=MMETSP0224-20130122/29726_1 /TAXON_ID=285029 /ORGANISM="Togula jolla, Strain CCCM 725" /LENGTH=344 /DNA_ID=CAMNT_0010949947 /DNA_START=46 /DNA_END=1080 /DNA_ORIENTATION=+